MHELRRHVKRIVLTRLPTLNCHHDYHGSGVLPTTEIAVGSLGKKVGQSMTNGTIPPSTKSPYKIRSSRSHPIFNGFKKRRFLFDENQNECN